MVKMGTVWDRTAEFLTDNLHTLLPIALLAYFVPMSIQGNFGPVIDNAGPGLVGALAAISLAFSALIAWGALTLNAMALELEGDPGKLALRRLVPALLVMIAIFLLICLLMLPPVLTVRVTGVALADMSLALPIAVVWALSLYVLLALVVVFWISARLILVYPIVVAEQAMFGAILRSWQLTRGIALPLVGVILLYILLTIVAVLATKLVFGSVFALVAGGADGLSLSGILTSVMVAAVQTAFFAVVPVFTAKLYQAVIAASAARA